MRHRRPNSKVLRLLLTLLILLVAAVMMAVPMPMAMVVASTAAVAILVVIVAVMRFLLLIVIVAVMGLTFLALHRFLHTRRHLLRVPVIVVTMLWRPVIVITAVGAVLVSRVVMAVLHIVMS